jgi:hypothetical protein
MQAPLVFRDLGSINKESLIRDNAQATKTHAATLNQSLNV